MEKDTTYTDIEDLFSRGVATYIDPDGSIRKKIEGKIDGSYTGDIVIKFGVDPTRPDIHLGHVVILKALRAFQNIGCKVIFLIGDFTATIGDPTGKSRVRPEVDQKEIEHNMKTYLEQVGKILKTDERVFSWIRNSDWFVSPTDINTTGLEPKIDDKPISPNSFLGKAIIFEKTRMQATHLKLSKVESVSFSNVLWTLRHITHAQLIERDMFQERVKSGESLFMHEMMYPVMQGIDSLILHKIYGSCDIEVGGTDQTFNMLMGREVMKLNSLVPQAVMSFDILPGTDGKEKMSKSSDNYIAITDNANDMFGKIMSIPDSVVGTYFKLLTYTPEDEINNFVQNIENGNNPKEIKMRLAREIVSIFHGEERAQEANDTFDNIFSKQEIPKDIQTLNVDQGILIGDILVSQEIVSSKSEWRRLVESGAVTDLERKIKIEDFQKEMDGDLTLKIGKHTFVKLITS